MSLTSVWLQYLGYCGISFLLLELLTNNITSLILGIMRVAFEECFIHEKVFLSVMDFYLTIFALNRLLYITYLMWICHWLFRGKEKFRKIKEWRNIRRQTSKINKKSMSWTKLMLKSINANYPIKQGDLGRC